MQASNHRRSRILGLLLTAWLGLAACTTEDGITPSGNGTRPVATPSIAPSASPKPSASASPTHSPTPTPTPSPTPNTLLGQTEVTSPDPNATPTPTPTPRATPLAATVQSVLVSPDRATINLPAANSSNDAGLPTTVQLSALVRLSDGTVATNVTWSASSGVVTVSQGGLVTAVTAGTVTVTATSQQDSTQSGSAVLTVEPNGLLDLVID